MTLSGCRESVHVPWVSATDTCSQRHHDVPPQLQVTDQTAVSRAAEPGLRAAAGLSMFNPRCCCIMGLSDFPVAPERSTSPCLNMALRSQVTGAQWCETTCARCTSSREAFPGVRSLPQAPFILSIQEKRAWAALRQEFSPPPTII